MYSGGPRRKITSAKYEPFTKGKGRVAELVLECGHVVRRAASDVPKKGLKCWQCGIERRD